MLTTKRLSDLSGVGPVVENNLRTIGIKTIEDLLNYYPRRYDDYSNLIPISEINPGQVSIKGRISNSVGRYVRRGMHITEAVLTDKTGSVRLVWFNQPYRANSLKNGSNYFVSGLFQLSRQRMSIINPSLELVSDFPINTARILPVYPQSRTIKSPQLRKLIKLAFDYVDTIPEYIPKEAKSKYGLISLRQALFQLHFPKSEAELSTAKNTLGFIELFELILASQVSKSDLGKLKSVKIGFDENVAKKFTSALNFDLTDDQRIAVWQIFKDIDSDIAMNRLLEGDVGSGKTVVSAMAAAMTISNNFQVLMLAPTEILARQHAQTMMDLLKPLKMDNYVSLLVGSMNKRQKENAYRSIKSGKSKILIGTHAILQEAMDVHSLGLIIVDEQHRFGVEQRKALLKKAGHMPHMLSMTATPIPRSLALTVYGDLEISLLKNKPKNRKPVTTDIVIQNERTKVYESLKFNLDNNEQIFVVCPLIEESDSINARSVNEIFNDLSKKIFKNYKVSLLHGRLSNDEKQQIMEKYIAGKVDVLVSTTVIEVGVDVANATVMCVESPERFGLAQIHQLRGRIGRGEKPGKCFLMLNGNDSPSRRLSALMSSNDGFKLAELDLELRGPGAIYGNTQHGLLDLRMAKLTDTKLIKNVRDAVGDVLVKDPNLLQYIGLKKRIEKLQKITHLN
ncbi:MAG TPA: ATP-dependent DNA helicase RecG [Candidatus Saccharibacteria bacterium]|nr:ATP-dependent DNA helicase RecG [Candidatus Saccharibacteria bacterium]